MGRQIFTIVSFITFQLMILARQADAGAVTVAVSAPTTAVLLGVGAAVVGVIAWWRGSRK